MTRRFLAHDYALTVIKPGYNPPKKAIVPRLTALLLLMPDPVNAWTRPIPGIRERPESGSSIRPFFGFSNAGVVVAQSLSFETSPF